MTSNIRLLDHKVLLKIYTMAYEKNYNPAMQPVGLNSILQRHSGECSLAENIAHQPCYLVAQLPLGRKQRNSTFYRYSHAEQVYAYRPRQFQKSY